MRSKKVLVAIVLVLLIVPGGILLGLTSRLPSSSPGASVAPSTQGLGVVNGGAGLYSFGALAGVSTPSGGPNVPITASTTTAMVATTTLTMTSAAATAPGSTTVIRSNPAGPGASLSPASANPNGTRSIEFFTNLTLQAESSSAAFAKASAIAYSLGGYVSDSVETNTTAFVVMRVPAASDQDALQQLEGLGTLVSLSSSSNDVTVQYTDLNATLQSLQGEQTSLLTILGQSTNINTTLSVEDRIQQVDQQINEVQSQILQTRTLVSYATVSVTLEQKAATQPLTIRLTATPRSGESPLSVTFNAVVKGGAQPYIVNYNFGDGSSYEGQALIHTFERPGTYNVTVTATDASANVTETWAVVSVSSPPAASGIGGFPSFVAELFLQVVEGMVEVAVVVLPVAGAVVLVLFPLRHRLSAPARRPEPKGEGSGREG